MSTNTDFDRHASAWLADGPTELADRVLDAALREVHLTRQARRGLLAPRRFFDMSGLGRVAAAAIVAVVAAVSAYSMLGSRLGPGSTSSPAVQPSPSQAPSPGRSIAMMTFTSPEYGYEVSIPATWNPTLATKPWPGGDGIESRDEPYLDLFRLEASPIGAAASVKAQAVPNGTTASSWLAQFEQIRAIGGQCFGSATPWTDATVAGLSARRFEWRCDGSPDGKSNYDEYTFLAGGMGYVIHGEPSMVEVLVQSFRAP
jgi:hypothetical protein